MSALDQSTVRELGLRTGHRVEVNGVGGETTGHWPTKFKASANGVNLPRVYLSIDLAALGNACGRRLDGLLGADFFRGRIVRIDFAGHVLRIVDSTELVPGDQQLPLQTTGGGFRVPVSVDGGELGWVRLDTGCATGLHWVSTRMYSSHSSHRPAVALTQLTTPVTETRVTLGNVSFPAVETALHEMEIFPGEAGLLGNEILSRFAAVTIDTRSGRLILRERDSPALP